LHNGSALLLDESTRILGGGRAALSVLALQPAERRVVVSARCANSARRPAEHRGLVADIADVADIVFTCAVDAPGP